MLTERVVIFIIGTCIALGTAALGNIITVVWAAAKVRAAIEHLRELFERHERENVSALSTVHTRIDRTNERIDHVADRVSDHDSRIAVLENERG